ncbi:MAG: signal recognition particle-docking protein FtsY [Candidatus Nitrospinota bacterium M3_3B_026]
MVFSLFGKKKKDKAEEAAKSDEESQQPAEPRAEDKTGVFSRLARGLSKTRKNLNEGFERLIGAHAKLDDGFMEELEEVLLSADIGVELAMRIVDDLRRDVKRKLLKDTSQVVDYIKKELVAIIEQDVEDKGSESGDKPRVILVVGVNGSGKTTTIGKLAAQMKGEGKSVLIAAADTFRAAAIEQLEEWTKRSGADFVKHKPGADPSAVVFDAMKAAVARGHDVMIADTAGRLQNKANLMAELEKINRVIGREMPGAPHEVLLVLDATTGQNAVSQAKVFQEAVGVTGIALTKLDGTAKGGVVINIMDKLKIPVKLIGVGEKIEDLRPFDPKEFVEAIFTEASFVE